MNNKSNLTQISQAKRLLNLPAGEMERDTPVHNLVVFLTIAESHQKGETMEVKELMENTGMKSSALSRCLGRYFNANVVSREQPS